MIDSSAPTLAAKRTYPKLAPESVPVIEHWVTLTDVADALDVSRSRAHQLAAAGEFKSLRRLSDSGRPQFLVKRSELKAYIDGRKVVADAKAVVAAKVPAGV